VPIDDVSGLDETTVTGAAAHIAHALFANDLDTFKEFDIRGFPEQDFQGDQRVFYSHFWGRAADFRIKYWVQMGAYYVVGIECIGTDCTDKFGLEVHDMPIVMRKKDGRFWHDEMLLLKKPEVQIYVRLMQGRCQDETLFQAVESVDSDYEMIVHDGSNGEGILKYHFSGGVPAWGAVLYDEGQFVNAEPVTGETPAYYKAIKCYRDAMQFFMKTPAEVGFLESPEFRGFLAYLEPSEQEAVLEIFSESDDAVDREAMEIMQDSQRRGDRIRFVVDSDPYYFLIVTPGTGYEGVYKIFVVDTGDETVKICDFGGGHEYSRIWRPYEIIVKMYAIIRQAEEEL
jgi:hypothetical protein